MMLIVNVARGNVDVERDDSANGPLEFMGEAVGKIAEAIAGGRFEGQVRDGNGNRVGDWVLDMQHGR